MIEVNIAEAREQFSKYLTRLERGEHVLLTRHMQVIN